MHFPFTKAASILDTLTDHGFEAYVVGGAVRDYLLGREIHDVDIATSAHPGDVAALFRRTIPVGIEHGTVLVVHGGQHYEVTTFRSESGYDDFRHPKKVTFERSLEKDLMRRDFTINALAMDRSGRVIDLFNGQKDMRLRLIRMVGKADNRISEDPLRIMRGIRFTAELGFGLGDAERRAFRERASLLRKISVERIDQEMTRLLAGEAARGAFRFLSETGCFRVLPRLEQAASSALEAVRFALLRSDEERWAAFLSALDIPDVHDFAKAWHWSRAREKRVIALQEADRIRQEADWNLIRVYRAGPNLAQAAERLQAAFGREDMGLLDSRMTQIDHLWRALPIRGRGDLAVHGGHLRQWSDEKPGPWLAKALAEIEEQVVCGGVPNELEAIQSWFEAWQKRKRKS
ncbi:CCA tRNA nucleotidyltransferase [Sporolactobacillus sp. THM7-7]|nr:CCA tRNA nucleotidyltransferase [Sporolactobacillus sp. THM7-7]